MTTWQSGWYSNLIIYDERKRYYYLWPRKNRPLLDDEVRNANKALEDQIRRSMEATYGVAGVPTNTYSVAASIEGFKVVAASAANGGSGNQYQNFLLKTGGNVENPAILFGKGFYVFYAGGSQVGGIEYVDQSDLGDLTDPEYTETPIPDLTDPAPGEERVDVVYIDLHFAEVSSEAITEYTDDNLQNPIVGTESASRARAVFDIRVWEDYRFKNVDGTSRTTTQIQNLRITEALFDSTDFLGSLDTEMVSDPDPVNKHYRIPIAILYRRGSQNIVDDDIIDLLHLYDRRILTLQELTHRVSHGGFTQRDVTEANLNSSEAGYSGLFTARFNYAKVDETAYATGANQGLDSEAFNTDSVTPRVLDTYGKFAMDALLVGGGTGSLTGPIDYVTGPEGLQKGEVVVDKLSSKSVYIGYDQGITGNREYTDRLNVHMQGITGDVGVHVVNQTGETGAVTTLIETVDHSVTVDYRGRVGVDTDVPGWSGPDAAWGTERYSGSPDEVDIGVDLNTSARVTKHAFIEKDVYIGQDAFGRSWRIPGVIDRDNPALIGFTGVPQIGVTGSPASLQVVPGILAQGVTGSLPGYTGVYGFYESYTPDGQRVFTLGSRGDPFDRQVLSLYGTSSRELWVSDADFLDLPGSLVSTQLLYGDQVTYRIELADGTIVQRTVGITGGNGVTGLNDVVEDINAVTGAGFSWSGAYTYYYARDFGDTGAPITETRVGERVGAEINWEGPPDDRYLRLVVKSMPEISLDVEDVNLTIARGGYDSQAIDFIESGYYGSGGYGGDVVDLMFAKFDLGEAADAWLFEGDVYFNGNGLMNRVVFSPNVLFRDDVYIYGNLSAQRLLLANASITNLDVDLRLGVQNYASIVEGLAVGYQPFIRTGYSALDTMLSAAKLTTFHPRVAVSGGIQTNNIMFNPGVEADLADFGAIWNLNETSSAINVRAVINGEYSSTERPFGIHLIDDRQGTVSDPFTTFVIDGHDMHGDSPEIYSVTMWLKGDLILGSQEAEGLIGGSALIRRMTLGLNATEVDDEYILSIRDGNAYISSLTVGSLSYDSDAPEAEANFYEPQNVWYILRDRAESDGILNKNDGITRVKEFSFDPITTPASKPPAFLTNAGKLPNTSGYSDFANDQGYWGLDTLTFTRAVVEKFSEERDDESITASQDFNKGTLPTSYDRWTYYRNYFSRIILQKLGNLKMTFEGYTTNSVPSGSEGTPITNANIGISEYQFSSSLFKRNETGSNTFDWIVPTNLYQVLVNLGFNDSVLLSNLLYNLHANLGIWIPLTSWSYYENDLNNGFYERQIYYRYDQAISNYNLIDVVQQTDLEDWNASSRSVGNWQAAIYPKINSQTIIGDPQLSGVRLYEVQWDINLILYPTGSNGLQNLAGTATISYM